MPVFRLRFTPALLIAALALSAAKADIVPGEWEWRASMSIPGMPQPMPPTVYRSCITEEDLIPQQQANPEHCTMLEEQHNGSDVHWRMECRDQAGVSEIVGNMSYDAERADGTIVVERQGMVMTTRMSGKRLGECPKMSR